MPDTSKKDDEDRWEVFRAIRSSRKEKLDPKITNTRERKKGGGTEKEEEGGRERKTKLKPKP